LVYHVPPAVAAMLPTFIVLGAGTYLVTRLR